MHRRHISQLMIYTPVMAHLTCAPCTLQVRAVGVCNYNAGQVEEMHGLLARHGIPLASNQVCLQDSKGVSTVRELTAKAAAGVH